MIIQSIYVEKFRAMEDLDLRIGNNLTAIAGRNATMKSTLLGMLGQPFSISSESPLYGERTIDGYNFKSQFREKFRLSETHDIAGSHKWKLCFKNSSFYHNDYIEMISVNRTQTGRANSIRFINAEGKSRGKGYVQLPVFYLSLSRIYPIGESGFTKTVDINLSEEETALYISWYKDILTIQDVQNASVNVERKDIKRVFAGISDDTHDVFTNSAGEGNIGRILMAVLSFKRLKDKYPTDYKGGILLLDELDATLYGYSQKKLVNFLYNISKEYRIQIIFTTHSPLILKEINKFQRRELKDKSIPATNTNYKYDCEIINLKPEYIDGKRLVKGKNIHTSHELKLAIDDINMVPSNISQSINVYLEDQRALSLMEFILEKQGVNYEQFINPVNVDLGWPNYVQLYEKEIPEFRNSLIVLDCDVKSKPEFRGKRRTIESAQNILFMPVDVEAGLYKLLRDHEKYTVFEALLCSKGINMSYDICFRDFVNDECKNSQEYKTWYKYVEESIKDEKLLFEVWYSFYAEDAVEFTEKFIEAYNNLAEQNELDYLIPVLEESINQEEESIEENRLIS